MVSTLVRIGLLLLLTAPVAFAHHPFAAEFDVDKPVKLTGTVTEFEWRNPHAGVHIMGSDAAGQSGEWVVELGGPDELARLGWNMNSLKAGDKITIEGWRAKDGTMTVNAKQVTKAGAAPMMAASSFDTKLGQPAGTSGQKPAPR